MKPNLPLCICGILFPFFAIQSFAQTISFEAPSEVCVNEIFTIQNTSQNVDNVFWNFCGVELDNPVEDETVQNIGTLQHPVFVEIAKQGDDYFAFVSNNSGKLTKLFFGNSLLNTPTETSLGDLNTLVLAMEAIQIIYDEGQWFGFIIGGTSIYPAGEHFIKLNFGNSLHNTPTATSFGNIGALNYPHDLHIFKENENWYGWTINKLSNSLTRFDFGNSLTNIPTAENVGNIGNLDQPTGFYPQLDDDEWFVFVTNQNSNTITRLRFGNQLSSIPTGNNLGNLGGTLQKPRDIMIAEVCDGYAGFVVNQDDNNLLILNFGNTLISTPDAHRIDSVQNLNFPHSISKTFREGNNAYFFIPNVGSHTLSRVKINGCNNAFPSSTSAFDPPPIYYDQEGTYIIQLITDIGLPTQKSYCELIEVLPTPRLDLGNDTLICQGQTLELTSEDDITIWQNDWVGNSFEVTESGLFFAETSYAVCSSYDSIEVIFDDCEECLIFANVFTPDGDFLNDSFQPIIECDNNLETYEMKIYNRWGQKVFSSNDLQRGWDGKFKERNASSDVYIWMVNYSYFDGEKTRTKNLKGDLTLIR